MELPSPEEKRNRLRNAKDPLDRLNTLAAILREPGGCDWDRKQTLESITPSLIEESYELLHALRKNDRDNFREELGDLLFLVVFIARLSEESGYFSLQDCAEAAVEKLVYRHPHVFADDGQHLQGKGAEAVLANWEKLKQKEKQKQNQSALFGADTEYLPSVTRAEKIQKKAAAVSFDFSSAKEVLSTLQSEISEAEETLGSNGNPDKDCADAFEEEAGDILFTAVNLARKTGKSTEELLHRSTEKFISRFRKMQELADLQGKSTAELDELYQKAKAELS